MNLKIISVLMLLLMATPAAAQIVTIGTFGGTVAAPAADQGHGWMYGFESKIKLVDYIYFRPSAAFGKLGDVSYDFGSRDGSDLRIYSFDFMFGKLPEKKNGFGGGICFGISYLYLSREYDRDIRERHTDFGACGQYRLFKDFLIELSGSLYGFGYRHVTADLRLGINYAIDLKRLLYGK